MGPRILIVNVNWLGDVLFSTPAIRAVRKKYPGSYIACLVPARCAALLTNNPHLNEVIEAEDRIPLYSFFKHWKIIAGLRRRHFDTAIFFHRSKTKAIWTWLGGIRERVGYAGLGRRRLLTQVSPNPRQPMHKTDYFLKLLDGLEIPSDGRVPDFFPRPEAAGELADLLRNCGIGRGVPYVVVHAGGNWALKRWPAAYFTKWISLFLARYPLKIVLCGIRSEQPISDEICAHFKRHEVISLCGKTTIDTLALLLKNAELLLTNDSGPIHLAASQGTKIVGLFGPTSPEMTGPVPRGSFLILKKDVGCENPCYYRSCDSRLCMEWLTPEYVFEKTVELLGEPKLTARQEA